MDENTTAITKSLSQAVADITDIVHRLFGPLADEFGQMMGDKVYEYRVRNFVSVMNRVKTLLADNRISPNAVPPRLLLPIADPASVEEDETLQQKWAGLLATASVQPDMSPSFAEVLKQLSPSEARILDSMYDVTRRQSKTEVHRIVSVLPSHDVRTWIKEPRLGPSRLVASSMKLDGTRAQLVLRNFERLGLVSLSYEGPPPGTYLDKRSPQQHIDELVVFTRFAEEFVEACRGPRGVGVDSAPTPTTR